MLGRKNRCQKGQSILGLGMVIGVFVVVVLGILAFEIGRVELAREQLQSVCDASALAGAATLAGSSNLDPALNQTKASNLTMGIFRKNSVLGKSLNGAIQVPNLAAGGDAPQVKIEFLDPNNDDAVVPFGDPKGKTMRVSSILALAPAFGQFLGIGGVPIKAIALGGVPDLDLVVCIDISGSIDDQTPVTFVRRQWNKAANKNDYMVTSAGAGSPVGALAQGKLYDILGPQPTGSAVNALPPQGLMWSGAPHSHPLTFDKVLRGGANTGAPPGNFPDNPAPGGTVFTDLVVNIDGLPIFNGISKDGYDFPNVGTLVEAARGNLESDALFQASKANLSLPGIVPKAGYQAKYLEMAKKHIHPLGEAQIASDEFFVMMNNNTKAHFCLVTFSTKAGESEGFKYTDWRVSPDYLAGGQADYPNPLIPLNKGLNQTKFNECRNALTTVISNGGTNIGDAVNTAVEQLKTNNRKSAKRAIVLFTDGMATTGGILSPNGLTNARLAAAKAKAEGIPIYIVGLAQTPAIVPDEVALLNDTNPDPGAGGMAAIAGNGGKFFLVTDISQLRVSFAKIARYLVQLVNEQ
jgi:hypothetical protein